MGWREWPGKLSQWFRFRRQPVTPARKLRDEITAIRADRDRYVTELERATANVERLRKTIEDLQLDKRMLQADIDVLQLQIDGLTKAVVAQHAVVEMVTDQATWLATQPGDRTKGQGNALGGGFGN